MSNAMSLKVRFPFPNIGKICDKKGMPGDAIVGLDSRATPDTDTTLKNLSLTPEAIQTAL